MALLIFFWRGVDQIRKAAAPFTPRQTPAFVNALQKIRGVAVPSRDGVTNAAKQQLRCSAILGTI